MSSSRTKGLKPFACLLACPPASLPPLPKSACLPTQLDAKERVQISQRLTKLRGCMLTAKYVNPHSSCARHLIQNTWFTCIYVYFILFCLQTQSPNSQTENNDIKMNNCSGNPKGIICG